MTDDPPRLRDLDGADDLFARALLRDAAPTRPFTPDDAARLVPAVALAKRGWFFAHAGRIGIATVVALVVSGVALRPSRAPHAPENVRTAPVAARENIVVRAEIARPSPRPVAPRATPIVTPASPAPRARRVASVAVAEAPRVTVAAAPRVAVAEAPRVAHVAATEVVHSAVAAPTAPTLADELRVIDEARAALRSDPSRAVRVLEAAESSMARGQMRDEREALCIEALARSGRWSEARARSAVLASRAPQSPQSARVRALLRDAP